MVIMIKVHTFPLFAIRPMYLTLRWGTNTDSFIVFVLLDSPLHFSQAAGYLFTYLFYILFFTEDLKNA